jgi:hypothetical protein
MHHYSAEGLALTTRERDVLRVLVDGHANAEMARTLGIREQTRQGSPFAARPKVPRAQLRRAGDAALGAGTSGTIRPIASLSPARHASKNAVTSAVGF